MTEGKEQRGIFAAASSALAETEAGTKASYLVQVRRELEENPEAREMVAEARPASGAKGELVRILSASRPGREYPVPKPGTEDLLEAAVDQVLAELEKQRAAPAALYVVDGGTGEVVMPLPEGGVYQPPDYVGEDGELHKSKPVVHPGITSSLALARAEKSRVEQALEKASDDPVARKAIEHLTEPQKMVLDARSRLMESGVTVSELPAGEDPEVTVEFGREHVNGVFQSPNLSFHRSSLFARSLADKVLQLCGSGGEARLGELKRVDNGKQSWYRIGVTARRPKQLQ